MFKRRLLSAGMVLGLAVAGGVQAQTLRIALQDDPDTLDPARARTYVSRIVFTSLCDKLVDVNEQLEFVPALAREWSWSEDGKVLTFQLRDDVVFHDGTPFNAAAAKANIERGMTLEGSQRRSELGSVDTVEAPDDTTLLIHVKQPDATLLAQLSDRAGMMLSPRSFETEEGSAKAGREPVCSGPYRFVKRVQNDRIELEKFDGYYDAANFHYEKLVFLPIPDTTVRLQNLRSGGIDILERLNPSDIQEVRNDDRLVFMPVTGLGFQQLIFNVNNGEGAKDNPFADKRLRQALQYTIDREAINQVVGNGIYEPAQQAFPPASPYHNPAYPPTTPDIDKAKALLKEAGVSEVRANLAFGNNTITSSVAEMLQAMAGQAGIHLNLRPTEYAAMLSEERAGNFQVDIRGWSGRVDPDGNVHLFMSCKGALNDGHYCNAEVDRLLNEARTVADVDKRKAIYAKAQEILQDELPSVYLYFQPWPWAISKKVEGFTAYPDGMVRLRGVKPAS
ncbi:MAG: ABC transporter substrate-binding protein [Castellaniella sp.]